jgi:hypothetical protein
MLYIFNLTVPRQTVKGDPYIAELPICAGTITRIWVRFRRGCGWLCGVRLHHAGVQRWPYSPDAWLTSHVDGWEWEDDYSVGEDAPYLILHAYNLSAINDHLLDVGVNVLRAAIPPQLARFVEWVAEAEA